MGVKNLKTESSLVDRGTLSPNKIIKIENKSKTNPPLSEIHLLYTM